LRPGTSPRRRLEGDLPTWTRDELILHTPEIETQEGMGRMRATDASDRWRPGRDLLDRDEVEE